MKEKDQWRTDLNRFVDDLLRTTVAVHKRRCAIRQGLREPDTKNCDHNNWSVVSQWCNTCGITRAELLHKEKRND